MECKVPRAFIFIQVPFFTFKCLLLEPPIHDIHFNILGELISLSEYIQQNLDSLDPRNNEVHEQFHRLQNLVLYEKYVLFYLKRESKDGQVIAKQIKRLKDIYERYVLDMKYLSSNEKPTKNEVFLDMNSSTNEENRKDKNSITVEHQNSSHENDLNSALKQEFLRRPSKEFIEEIGNKTKSVSQKSPSFPLGNEKTTKNEFFRGMNSSTNEGNRNSKDTITVEQPNPSHGNDLSLALKQEFRKRSSKEFGDKRKSVPQKRASFKLGESILITQYSITQSHFEILT